MHESLDSAARKAGLPPGSLVHVGERFAGEPRASLLSCNEHGLLEQTIDTVDDIPDFRDIDAVTWVHIEGLHNITLVEKLGERLGVHSLVLEDILNTHQRPKFEEYGGYIYIVVKSILAEEGGRGVVVEQLSLLLFDRLVISFSERPSEIFAPMRRRVQANAARYRALGADYLAYALIDTVVDGYFHIQDAFENALERLDEELLDDPGQSTLASIHEVKRAIITTRRAISPLRELLLSLQHSDSGLIRPATKLYFRDVYDHSLRVMELVESSREIIADMTGVYLSFLSNRMNEIMKVLTLFMAIFIPLTFIAGIYGMNFEYMPELEFRWAYPAVWGVCILLTLLMLLFFRRKKWL